MRQTKRLTIPQTRARQIVREVLREHSGVVEREVYTFDRRGIVVAARFDAYRAVARAFPDASLAEVGRQFGRTHAAVMNGLGLLRKRPRWQPRQEGLA